MKTHSKLIIAGVGTAALLAGGATTTLAASQAAAPDQTGASAVASASAPKRAITCATAVKIAKKRVPGARVTEVEREWEHGHRVCKVELWKGGWEYDVYVSLTTGKVIKFKKDDD